MIIVLVVASLAYLVWCVTKDFREANKEYDEEVDEDGNESVTWEEFLAFWRNVVASGYSQDDILEEVQMMIEGGSWVDFDDGRTT